MNLTDFDLNLLIVFDAIYQEKNLTRAGQRLHLSQPAISHALNRLRNAFNNPLFVRQANQMNPTAVAEQLSAPIRDIIRLAEKTIADQGRFDPRTSERTFHIGMQDYPMMVVLPKLLEILHKEAPHVGVRIYDLNMEDRRTALEEGNLELVIGCQQEYGSNIYQQHLFSDREVCILRRDHPCITDTLSLEQYVDAEFIRLSVSNLASDRVDTRLEEIGKKRNIRVTVEQEVAIFQLICRSELLANVAELAAREYLRFMPIKILPIPLESIEIQHFQYWHARYHQDEGHIWLREKIKTLSNKLLGLEKAFAD